MIPKHIDIIGTMIEHDETVVVVKTLLENGCQLCLQSSSFGLVFERVSAPAKVKLLLPMSLGLLSATCRAC